MFTKEELHRIGEVTKLHGYKGELTVFLDTESLKDYTGLATVYLEVRGQLVPYQVEQMEQKTNKTVKLKLEDINSENDARALVKAEVYIRKEELSERDEARQELRTIQGYDVIDAEKGPVGRVAAILELSSNPQLEIEFGGKTILLPLREEFIHEIDKERRQVHIAAPPGLIDLYLGE